MIENLDKRLVRLETKVDDMDNRLTRVEAKVDDVDNRLIRVEAKVDAWETKVPGAIPSAVASSAAPPPPADPQNKPPAEREGNGMASAITYAGSASPMKLNEEGLAAAKELDAEATVLKYKDQLFRAVGADYLDNAYDTHITCVDFAMNQLIHYINNEELSRIKQKAFLDGKIKQHVLYIYGLLLRDIIIKEKGISTAPLAPLSAPAAIPAITTPAAITDATVAAEPTPTYTPD